MAACDLTKILEYHQRKDPDQSHQQTLFANLSGMAKEIHVVGVPDPIWALSGETPDGLVEVILSMDEAPRGTKILILNPDNQNQIGFRAVGFCLSKNSKS